MKLPKLWKDERGVGTIEYALVASLIAIAAVSGYQELGSGVKTRFATIDAAISNVL